MLGRLSQKTKEKFGKALGSKYPAEMEAECREMEGLGSGVAELVERIQKHLKTLEGPGKTLKVEVMGQAFGSMACALPSSSPYSQSLNTAAKTETEVGRLERQYTKDVEEKVVGELNSWREQRHKVYKKERANLEKARLDMDHAIAKARERPDAPDLKASEEARTKEHDDLFAALTASLEKLPADRARIRDAIAVFFDLQRTLAAATLAVLDGAIAEIGARVQ